MARNSTNSGNSPLDHGSSFGMGGLDIILSTRLSVIAPNEGSRSLDGVVPHTPKQFLTTSIKCLRGQYNKLIKWLAMR